MPRPKHDVITLAVTAAFTSAMNHLLETLEITQTARATRSMAQRLRRNGIDTSHWEPSSRVLYSDAQLARAVETSTTYAGALRLMGVPVTGGQHAHLARRIRTAQIDTSHFLGQGHARGSTRPGRDPKTIFTIWPPGSDRPRTKMLRRVLLEQGVAHSCAVCDCGPEWRGQPMVLVIDHKNGDWLDNRLENLRFLCPNCHSQTVTWCRRSKGDRAH